MWDEGAVSFTHVTGGAGGAAGNGGVPVLQGLGGGWAKGVLFPGLIWFGARVAESSRIEAPGMCFCSWSFFLALGPVFRTGRKPTVAHSALACPSSLYCNNVAIYCNFIAICCNKAFMLHFYCILLQTHCNLLHLQCNKAHRL